MGGAIDRALEAFPWSRSDRGRLHGVRSEPSGRPGILKRTGAGAIPVSLRHHGKVCCGGFNWSLQRSVKHICRSGEGQRLPRSFVEAASNPVQVCLREV